MYGKKFVNAGENIVNRHDPYHVRVTLSYNWQRSDVGDNDDKGEIRDGSFTTKFHRDFVNSHTNVEILRNIFAKISF